jgi:hypothetical protein
MHTKLATTRRQLLRHLGLAGATLMSKTTFADSITRLPPASDQRQEAIATAFPQKRAMILRRTRPPLLETPIEAFDNSVFTPNDVFYVR